MIKVAKFGGTSMADANAFGSVAETILRDKDIKIIVVSAGGKIGNYPKITDMLNSAYAAIKNGQSPKRQLSAVVERVCELKTRLRLKSSPENQLMKIEDETACGSVPDFLLSRGERIYSELFAEFIGMPFIDAKDLYKFDEQGKLNCDFTYYNIRKAYRERGTFVTGGFYGEDENGNIKTFPRGGGDVSGAIAARAISADVFLDYTDVNGVYSYDPRIVKNAKPVKKLSYAQIRRLGEFGASVLHPDSVLPLEETGIPALIKNTFDPFADGTVISSECGKDSFAAAVLSGCFYAKVKTGYLPLQKLTETFINSDAVNLTVTSDYVETVCRERPTKLLGCENLQGYIESDVALFYIADGERGREFVSQIVAECNTLYVGSVIGGFFVAVRGAERHSVENAISCFCI